MLLQVRKGHCERLRKESLDEKFYLKRKAILDKALHIQNMAKAHSIAAEGLSLGGNHSRDLPVTFAIRRKIETAIKLEDLLCLRQHIYEYYGVLEHWKHPEEFAFVHRLTDSLREMMCSNKLNPDSGRDVLYIYFQLVLLRTSTHCPEEDGKHFLPFFIDFLDSKEDIKDLELIELVIFSYPRL